jgi:predicted ATPase/class 3 adenylate cyclase/DNA-binding SARP family transcriptional activator/Flp pilus assembly protein TadD
LRCEERNLSLETNGTFLWASPGEVTVSDDAPTMLVIRLFGPLEVQINGTPLPRLRSRKGYWLLALLVLRGGQRVDRSWLAELLWPDSSPELAFLNLRSSLNDLRRALGTEAGRLHSPTKHTLCLDLAGTSVDLVDFDAAVTRGDPDSLTAAVGLYRGPLLEGCAEEWVLSERQGREQSLLRALEALAEQALAAGDAALAEQCLRRAVSVDRLREGAQRRLMEALAAGGNYAAALATYRELRHVLHRELNASPDPETQALFERIRSEAQRASQATAGPPSPSLAASAPASGHGGSGVLEPGVSGSKGTITLLLTDIEGSTRLWEAQPAAMEAALARHDHLAAAVIEEHEGTLIKQRGEGDSLFAVFPHALDAVKAALALQQAHQVEAWPEKIALRVRMALHTGDAVWRDGDYFGPAVNRCSRLRAAAHGGQILLSAATVELVRDQLDEAAGLRDLGECRLKDLIRPEHIYQLIAPGLPADSPPLMGLDTRPHNLPAQLTPLVGREHELAALRRVLQREEIRLVTLTGPGGTGKTRLALQVAAELIEQFADGAFFVDLAPLRDPALVISTIAQELGVRESGGMPLIESVKGYLRDKQLLLVLDNFEQVLAAGPVVTELLEAAPRLKALATSRALLRLRGEQEYPVPPLPVPDPKRLPPLAALSQYAAVELFIQRAVNARLDFAVTTENAPAVAEICHRLDGLPLALELAAARIRLFPPEALLSRLDRRLPLLTGGARDLPARQRTLRDTIAWSYDLLSEDEKLLFRRLAVFVGGWTIEAAEQVCSEAGETEIEVVDGLASLVEQSLVGQEEAEGEPRFGMLETIREFGLECLTASEESEAVRRQHAGYYLALAEAAQPHLTGPNLQAWLDRLEQERANLRAVLGWAVTTAASPAGREAAEIGLRLAAALSRFWHIRGDYTEGRGWLATLLGNCRDDGHRRAEVPPAVRARALSAAGSLAWPQGDGQAARSLLQQSLSLARELGDRPLAAHSLMALGLAYHQLGEFELAQRHLEESLVLCQELGDRRRIAMLHNNLGVLAREQGQYERARALLEEALRVAREEGAPQHMVLTVAQLGMLHMVAGDYPTALAYYQESMAAAEKHGDQRSLAIVHGWMGTLARCQRDLETARARYAESIRIQYPLGERTGLQEWITGMGCVEIISSEKTERGGEAAGRRLCRGLRLLGAAEAVRETTVRIIWSHDRPEYERCVAVARAALGEEAFAAAWADGRAMSLEEAVAYALKEPSQPEPNVATD